MRVDGGGAGPVTFAVERGAALPSLIGMSDLLVGALSVLLATNQPAALSNYVSGKVGVGVPAIRLPGQPDPSDPRYQELQRVMEADDAADDEIGRWINERAAKDPGDLRTESQVAFRRRVDERNAKVKELYVAFLVKHPDYAPGRNAYASFLAECGDEEEAIVQLERAAELDPRDPSIWNNLANHYGHIGPVLKAFPAYEKAIDLNPYEPIYRYNLATVVFLFRKDAMEYYRCDEQAVFNRALAMYREVRRLQPNSFRYAFDFAQTFYGVKPAPSDTPEGRREAELKLADAARTAWREALAIADNDEDREGVHLHLARWDIRAGHFESARTNLARVTNAALAELKGRVQRNLDEKSGRPPLLGPVQP